jgi:predicted nucleic acid-binding protein
LTAFVVDASVVGAWLFADEQSPQTDMLQDWAGEQGAIAPALWPYEVVNLVLSARRRRQLDDPLFERLQAILPTLPVTVEADQHRVFDGIAALAIKHGLTVYDAAYLDLALLRRLPLATLDRDLRRAAEAEGVKLLPS